jgi:DNA-binding XRE family transcriptional regulator
MGISNETDETNETPEPTTLAQRLTQLRKRAGLTQMQVARKCDVYPQSVGQWESGKGYPSGKTALLLMDLFGGHAEDYLRD